MRRHVIEEAYYVGGARFPPSTVPVLVEALLSLLQCEITEEYLQMDLTSSQERFLSNPDAADPKLPSRHS